jgi:hypothetical protein
MRWGTMTGTRRCSFGLLAIMITWGLAGCQSEVSRTPGYSSGSSTSGDSGDSGSATEMRGDVAEAQLELAAAKEDLAELVKGDAAADPEALDAILEKLGQAESRLDQILERVETIEGSGGR